ncbi:5-amino-6-(5-phosphoribosylamino)uracil reductase [Philodulcilactobacillus myokoensis]|uniref:5-amino-6-(5-phosphoribosylamino)uracil reductase n=1 Tax=Philodulcilactobacillus myokoensis TaxID=2929573 RepID=A0A9W6AYR9_9LACO|nr:RibD family protein [Philodulcilactobacillus myokoensis]GLB46090.1 5-amino-6-(5-phosphoribosylamino)uracil reductase [Philodulcilactobacillus myokoensis]
MDRPYVFCYMAPSIDGKISGPYQSADSVKKSDARKSFYAEAFLPNGYYYDHQGIMCGRLTTEKNITHYKKPQLNQNVKNVPQGDFVANTEPNPFYISIDPHGKLDWQSNQINYGNIKMNVLEIITEKTSNPYKQFLRDQNISYIIAGNQKLDLSIALKKIKSLFKVNKMMLGGGGVLNWSLVQQGLCDEVSIMIMPSADGSQDTPSLFQSKPGISTNRPVNFHLQDVKGKNNVAWLRYKVESINK